MTPPLYLPLLLLAPTRLRRRGYLTDMSEDLQMRQALASLTGNELIYATFNGFQFKITAAAIAALGGGGGSPVLSSISFAFTAAGPYNDLGASVLTGYNPGTTNRLILTAYANSGNGTVINGLDATNCGDNYKLLVNNPSITDPLIFAHQAAGSQAANRFSNANGQNWAIPPLGTARLIRVGTVWCFE